MTTIYNNAKYRSCIRSQPPTHTQIAKSQITARLLKPAQESGHAQPWKERRDSTEVFSFGAGMGVYWDPDNKTKILTKTDLKKVSMQQQ